MSQRPPARVGQPMAEIDTPALIIDLDAFEQNLKLMANAAKAAGVRLRPHAKTHKSPVIGLKQMALGAVGLCCQKVSEAEALIQGGISDVLISNEVVGSQKLDRLAALARQARVMVVADNVVAIDQLEHAASRAGVKLRVLVEINVGAERCGVAPGHPAVELAQHIRSCQHLEFAGLQAYQGRAQHIRRFADRRQAIETAIELTRQTVADLANAGFHCDVVGGAGTGTFEIEAGSGVYNELQAGSYCFMDADYGQNLKADETPFNTFENALFVYATIMSMPSEDRAIVDAGLKALAFDAGPPLVSRLPGAAFSRPSDEHGNVDLAACNARPALGDKLLLIPGHCDPTVNLHDWYVGVRGMATSAPRVESIWPVAARGAIF